MGSLCYVTREKGDAWREEQKNDQRNPKPQVPESGLAVQPFQDPEINYNDPVLEENIQSLLSSERAQTPLPTSAKNFSVTWKTSEACFQIATHLQQKWSKESLTILQRQGASGVLHELLVEGEPEKVFWALVALQAILRVADAYALDFGKALGLSLQTFTTDTLWQLLVHPEDLIKVQTLKVLAYLNSSCNPTSFCEWIAAGLNTFTSLHLMKKNVKVLGEVMKLNCVQSEELNASVTQAITVRARQTLNHLGPDEIQKKEIWYKLENIRYFAELRSWRSQPPPPVDDKYIKHFIQKVNSAHRKDIFRFINDPCPATNNESRADLFPVSCCGTLAVIFIICSLQEQSEVPQDLIHHPELAEKTLANLRSDRLDLRQYTLILLSFIFFDPVDCQLTDSYKAALLGEVVKFLNSGVEELRYLSGCLIKNLCLRDTTFLNAQGNLLQQIVWSLLGYSEVHYFVGTLQNILELIADENMNICPDGLQLLSSMHFDEVYTRALHLVHKHQAINTYSEELLLVESYFKRYFLIRETRTKASHDYTLSVQQV